MTERYVVRLEDFSIGPENMRLYGLKLLQNAQLRIPSPILIVTSEAFQKYQNDGIGSIAPYLTSAAEEILKENPNKGIAFRRGFSRGLGYRSPVVKSANKAPIHIEKIFEDGQRARDFYKEEFPIYAFMHPFIQPQLPHGGGNVYLHRMSSGAIFAVIKASFGNDETTEWGEHTDSDKYLVAIGRVDDEPHQIRPNLLEKVILQKRHYVDLSTGSDKKRKLPLKLQREQVLSQPIIMEIAANAGKFLAQNHLYHENPLYRLEFDIDHDGLWFTECARMLSGAKELNKELNLEDREILLQQLKYY